MILLKSLQQQTIEDAHKNQLKVIIMSFID